MGNASNWFGFRLLLGEVASSASLLLLFWSKNQIRDKVIVVVYRIIFFIDFYVLYIDLDPNKLALIIYILTDTSENWIFKITLNFETTVEINNLKALYSTQVRNF